MGDNQRSNDGLAKTCSEQSSWTPYILGFIEQQQISFVHAVADSFSSDDHEPVDLSKMRRFKKDNITNLRCNPRIGSRKTLLDVEDELEDTASSPANNGLKVL